MTEYLPGEPLFLLSFVFVRTLLIVVAGMTAWFALGAFAFVAAAAFRAAVASAWLVIRRPSLLISRLGRFCSNLKRERMLRHFCDLLAAQLFDLHKQLDFIITTKGYRFSALPRSAGSAYTMHICFADLRQIKVDYVRKLADIEPSCGYVCRN